MRKLLSFIGKIIFLIGLVVSHFFLSYSLPFPLNTINILFAVLIVTMILAESGVIVWMAFFTHLCIELYSVTPFGIILASSTLSILFTFWMFQYVFTNRSWYSAIFLTFFSLFLYRSISFVLLVLYNFLSKTENTPWSNFVILALWELLFTEIAVLIFYTVVSQFYKKGLSKKRIHL